MSSAVTSAPAPGEGAFGLEPGALQALRGFFDATEGLQRVWVFGSRARDDWRARSDLDLALDAPGWSAKDFLRIKERMKDLPIVYPLDVVHWQGVSTPEFVAQIERDRKLLWEPRRGAVSLPRTLGATDLKKFQDESLQKLDAFVSELRARKQESDDLVAATTQFKAMESMQDSLRTAADYPRHAWDALRKAGALAYTLQLYFDFSAYSDMAIGLSLIIGVRLPLNFNSPYKAANIIDFWRRWHMTLSTFLRDYLYIPLGGNRKGPKRRYVNLYLTMLLGGFWHGAGWTFIIWGALHGLYLVINHGWRAIRPGAAAVPIWQRFLFRALTFLAVVVAWVFFRAPDVASALSILSGMAGLNHFSVDGAYSLLKIDGDAAWKIAAALAIVFLLPNSQEIVGVRVIDPDGSATSGGGVLGRVASRMRWAATPASGILMGALFFVCLLKLRQVSEFIYYQF